MRKISKFAAILLAAQMLMLSGLYQSVSAAMIRTESIIQVDRGQSPRGYVNSLLARAEIRAVLVSHGIDPQEARNRIDSLSDNEIAKFVHEIDQLPDGGSHVAAISMSLIFLFLMVIDLFYDKSTPDD
jgi:hypothetical protein